MVKGLSVNMACDLLPDISKAEVEAPSDVATVLKDGNYLFTTKTCPNCKMAESFLEKAKVPYVIVDSEDNPELVKAFGIMQAPTLVVVKDGSFEKQSNASNIKKFAEMMVKAKA